MLKFRPGIGYRPEFYVSYLIPSDEDHNTVPYSAIKQEDGSYRMDSQVGYSYGDLSFAKMHMELVLRDHPAWKGEVRRIENREVVTLASADR